MVDVGSIIEKTKLQEVQRLKQENDTKEKRIQELSRQLATLAEKDLPGSLEKLTDWLGEMPISCPECIEKVDPIFGHLHLEKEIVPVYLHPLVQRLGYVRQLSFSYAENAGGNHTRLAHSLGVCKNAELALSAVFRRDVVYSMKGEKTIELSVENRKELVRKIKIAGLVHDIGHAPFGHALDRYFQYSKGVQHPDKQFGAEYLENRFSSTLENPKAIEELLAFDKTELSEYDVMLGDIIDSDLDVDRMDYLIRDAHSTGLSVGFVNAPSLIEFMAPFKDEETGSVNLAYQMASLPYIEHFVYARDAMFAMCYESSLKSCGEGMLVKALTDLVDHYVHDWKKVLLLGDEQLIDAMILWTDPDSVCSKIAKFIRRGLFFDQVYEIAESETVSTEVQAWWDSSQKVHDIVRKSKAESSEVQAWWDSSQKVHDIVRKSTTKSSEVQAWWESKKDRPKDCFIEKPKSWEGTLAQAAGVDDWKVLVTVPSPKVLQVAHLNVRLIQKCGTGYRIQSAEEKSKIIKRVLSVLSEARSLFRVFVSRDLDSTQREKVRKAAEDIFGKP